MTASMARTRHQLSNRRRRRRRPENKFLDAAADTVWEVLVLFAICARGVARGAVAIVESGSDRVSRMFGARHAGARKRIRERIDGKADAPQERTTGHEGTPVSWDDDRENPVTRVHEVVTFDDVVGLSEVKKEIRMKAVLPLFHRDLAEQYDIKVGGGVLLYGPPGTGKTLIAKAVATEINAPFRSVTAADLLSNQVGDAERNIRNLFHWARAQKLAVIFIDEMEAIAPSRKSNTSTIMARVVPQILQEMQGVATGNGKVLIIGATNVPWMLDPAMLRPGRFDALIYVPLPGLREREGLVRKFLAGRPVGDDVDCCDLAERLDGYSGADIERVCEVAARIPFLEATRDPGSSPRSILTNDFESAVEQTVPSVNIGDLRQFRRWHDEHLVAARGS